MTAPGARALLPLAVVAGLAPRPAEARTLDRRTAIRAAIAQNPRVAAARAEEAVVAAQARQADAARWPMLSVDAGIGPSLKATRVPGTADQSVERGYGNLFSDLSAVLVGDVTIVQPLYTFGKIALRKEAAEHGLRARQAQTRMEKADVALEVARIYEGYLLARDAERFFQEITHWLDSTLQSTEDKLARDVAGVSERDVLRLQAGMGAAAMGLHQAQAGEAEARAGLVAYLGLPAGEELSFAEPELGPVCPVPSDFSSLVALAAARRPELVALREGTAALAALERAEAAGWAPDVFALAFLSAAYTPGRDWLETRFVIDPLNHVTPGALVGLRWQLQGPMASARADEQRARAAVLEHLGRWADLGIPAELRRAYEEAARAGKDVERGSEVVGKAKRWMVQAAADYSVGMLDVRETFDAVQAYVSLRTAVMKARYDYNVAMAALSAATGTLDGDSDILYLTRPETPNERTTP